ncbi:MAG: 1-phosphofructokinase family hexose kinase [Bacteroidota bacterium]
MSDIVTITFSPCIDKSTSVSQLIPEKKLKCAYPKLEPGGGGINIARAIKKLGGDATAIFPAGGYTGKYFIELMRKENVPSVIIETENETRENIIVLDESTNQQYRFGMPGNPLLDSEWKNILKELEQLNEVKYIVASGSLPPGVPVAIFSDIAAIANRKNAKFIADTSGESLKHAASHGVFLLKPNLAELSYLAGKKIVEIEEVPAIAEQLIANGSCEAMVVSLGGAGAMLVTATMKIKITPPPVQQKSTVGAGDSMVAGIVLSLYNHNDLETAVEYGVACGTAATLSEGTGLCKPEDVNRLFAAIRNKMKVSLSGSN